VGDPFGADQPGLWELKKACQSIKFKKVTDENGLPALEIKNAYAFRGLENFVIQWELIADGETARPAAGGEIRYPAIVPGGSKIFPLQLPEDGRSLEKEYFLNVRAIYAEAEPLIPAGHIAAADQFAVGIVRPREAVAAQDVPVVRIGQNTATATIQGPYFSATFDKATGLLASYVYKGTALVQSGLEPDFWRAPTDNDFGSGMPERAAIWRKAGDNRTLDQFAVTQESASVVRVEARYSLKDIPASYRVVYRVFGTSDILVYVSFEPQKWGLPELPRLGMKMALPKALENVKWHGRGPHENYIDRKTSAFVGLYEAKVFETLVPYVSIQEYGNRTDCRWAAFSDAAGNGILAVGLPQFDFSAIPYTAEDLTQDKRAQKHPYEVPERDFVALHLDYGQQGVGGDNSWGAREHPQYRLDAKAYAYSFRLRGFSVDDNPAELAKLRLN
jgi:beta-galactosidase